MKKLLILFLISSFAKTQTTTPDSAKYFEGSHKTVCGKITSNQFKAGNMFMNFGAEFPNHSFTAVIFNKDVKNFPDSIINKLHDINVCVIGKVKMYKGKPEIIINRPDQIRFPD
jgi:hypothetical protein